MRRSCGRSDGVVGREGCDSGGAEEREAAEHTVQEIGMDKAKLIRLVIVAAVTVGVAASWAPFIAGATTLDDVKRRGILLCGVGDGLPGFSAINDKGQWEGLDVDMCRAVAAAALGSADKVKYVSLTTKERFTALQSAEVDMLARNTTWSLTRDAALGVNFAGVNFYDGQGFMVRKELGLKSAKELGGATICLLIGTTTELNLADFFTVNNLSYRHLGFETVDEVLTAYEQRRCDALTTDRSALAARRLLLKNPDDHMILPEVISKEPLGPVVRQGDDQWMDLVRWCLYAMLEAEEDGVTSENVDRMRDSAKPIVRRLLGVEGKMGENLGVSNDWAYRIIKQVGNYAESYDRNVGPDTPLGLERGINRLWKDGGIQYAMPVR